MMIFKCEKERWINKSQLNEDYGGSLTVLCPVLSYVMSSGL